MKHKIRRLSLLAAVSLTVTTLCGFSYELTETEKIGAIAESTKTTKITENLQAVLDNSSDDDLIPVYIWINDIDYDAVEKKTMQASGFSKESLIEKSDKIYKPLTVSLAPDIVETASLQEKTDVYLSDNYKNAENITKADTLSIMQDFYSANETKLKKLSDDVDLYVDTSRKFAKEAYNEENSKFVNNHLGNAKILFQSEYAPMIICEIPKSDILYFNTLNAVESLSLYENIECSEESSVPIMVECINGDYTRDTLGFDGNGVKVGQIEPGVPKTGIAELNGTKITRYGTNYQSDHATKVASIIAGKTGMSPKAELYCTSSVDLDGEFYQNVEWLISSGVSVINMSDGFTNAIGEYKDKSKWVDHVVYQHGVSFVKSSGNGGDKNQYVSYPGDAYNVITVGAIDDKGTVRTNDDTFCDFSSYKTGSGMPMKPDVVAPGAEGTSYAAPLVTGMIAQMMSFCPSLKLRPDAIKAAVVASCDRKTTNESMNRITDKEGSGVVNAINAANSISNVLVQKTSYLTNERSISFDFYPLTTGTKTIAIAWLKNTVVTNSHTSSSPKFTESSLVDFDLYVYDYNGNPVASSATLCNSVEMVRFNATTINKYTVTIKRRGDIKSYERISLAHVRD